MTEWGIPPVMTWPPKKQRHVCVVLTARASYARIRSALRAIRSHPNLKLQLVLTASALLPRYGDLRPILERDGISVDRELFTVIEGGTPASMVKTTGHGLLELSTALAQLQPHIVLTVADRHETIATAIAASYMNIPLVHVQGGEVTGSIDQRVRNAISQLADIHLVATEFARSTLCAHGIPFESISVTGCPSIDLAAEAVKGPWFDPIERYGGVGADISFSGRYLVVLQHPVTTEWGDAREQVEATLEAVRASEGSDRMVLAECGCGHGHAHEWHPQVSRGRHGEREVLQELLPARLHQVREWICRARRKFQRRDPGVFVPGCSGGEYRYTPAGPRVWRQRGSCPRL